MKQRLIVEGKDAIVLANICAMRKLPPPTNYSKRTKFIKEFVFDGKGYDGAIEGFKKSLHESDLQHLGIVVDADQKGANARWDALCAILANYFSSDKLKTIQLNKNGIVLKEETTPTVGIWIMPDNSSNGYLEHFVSEMIPNGDRSWVFTNEKVEELMKTCLLYTSPSPRDRTRSRMPSSA